MRRRASGRIEKEVSGGSADSEERQKKEREEGAEWERKGEKDCMGDVEGDGGGD